MRLQKELVESDGREKSLKRRSGIPVKKNLRNLSSGSFESLLAWMNPHKYQYWSGGRELQK